MHANFDYERTLRTTRQKHLVNPGPTRTVSREGKLTGAVAGRYLTEIPHRLTPSFWVRVHPRRARSQSSQQARNMRSFLFLSTSQLARHLPSIKCSSASRLRAPWDGLHSTAPVSPVRADKKRRTQTESVCRLLWSAARAPPYLVRGVSPYPFCPPGGAACGNAAIFFLLNCTMTIVSVFGLYLGFVPQRCRQRKSSSSLSSFHMAASEAKAAFIINTNDAQASIILCYWPGPHRGNSGAMRVCYVV